MRKDVQTHALPANDLDSVEEVIARVARNDFCFIPGERMYAYLEQHGALTDWPRFQTSWNGMPCDQYMADGGRYRHRRHATLTASPSNPGVRLAPHQPHYQSLAYNSLNGGIARHYQPIAADVVHGATMASILAFCRTLFDCLLPGANWHIELHQFRIVADAGQSGLPTPEGNHRDGVTFVLVMMVKRCNIASGTTTIFDLAEHRLDSFTLTEPFDAAIVNDERCLHGVTPVVQLDRAQPAYRDVLVVTFRKK